MTDLTAPEFGQLTVDSTLPDSVASYTCDSGYTLVGEATRTCTVNGWSGTNPVCGKGILNILYPQSCIFIMVNTFFLFI